MRVFRHVDDAGRHDEAISVSWAIPDSQNHQQLFLLAFFKVVSRLLLVYNQSLNYNYMQQQDTLFEGYVVLTNSLLREENVGLYSRDL